MLYRIKDLALRILCVCVLGLVTVLVCLGQSTSRFEKAPLMTVQSNADSGDPEAQFELAYRYMAGRAGARGNETNFVQAAIWMQKSADQGFAIAQHNLGGLYYSGFGAPRDYVQAFKWYRKSADQGFSPSQAFLGWAYSQGKGGLTEDYHEAIKWYSMAAEGGDQEAQLRLGMLYLKGEDLNPNYEEAYKWINLSAAQGSTNAVKLRRKISLSMTSDQVAEGQRRANDFAVGKPNEPADRNGAKTP
jgi:TPR repeat protein